MIDADDLALLTSSFAAVMEQAPGAGEADVAMYELGWPDLLAAAPRTGAAAAFAALGATGSAATLLDDVLLVALGLPADLSTCVVLPAPHRAAPAGRRRSDGTISVEGLVSSRVETASRAVLPIAADGRVVVREIAASALRGPAHDALDPARPYRRVAAVDLAAGDAAACDAGSWEDAVRAARVALAHQLIGASRHMLELARAHAVDRTQFGRAIASFQAVRHRLADSLVAIEAAAAAADVAPDVAPGPDDPLVAALAKSLAGKAARVTAMHAQQVLAGIGFTTDHSFHRFMKRTMVVDTLFGSAKTLPVEIGHALLSRRAAPRLIEL